MYAKKLYTVFFIGVLMFVAKPFIGFSVAGVDNTIDAHSILAKSFTVRKPEDLLDAKKRASSIQQQLTNPPLPLLFSLAAILAFVFPLLFQRRTLNTASSFLNSLKLALMPAEQPYLLTGKLTI